MERQDRYEQTMTEIYQKMKRDSYQNSIKALFDRSSQKVNDLKMTMSHKERHLYEMQLAQRKEQAQSVIKNKLMNDIC